MITIEKALNRYFRGKESFGYIVISISYNKSYEKYIFYVPAMAPKTKNWKLFELNVKAILDKYFNINISKIQFANPAYYTTFINIQGTSVMYSNGIASAASSPMVIIT